MTEPTHPNGADNSVLAVLLACATLTVMAGATISASLPDLMEHFANTPNVEVLVPLILTSPGLAIAISAPLFGVLVDKTDPRIVLVLAIIVYVIAGSSGLYFSDLSIIIIGRMLLGVAVGGIMTSSTTLISHFFAGAQRAKIIGYQASAMGFGGVIFILAGSFLADLSWRAPFSVYLAPIFLVPLVIRVLPKIDRADPVAAEPGAGTAFPRAFAALIFVLAFIGFLIFYMVPTQLPFFVNMLGAQKASTAGIAIAITTLTSALVSMNFGRLRARAGHLSIGAAGFGLIGLSYIGMSQAANVNQVFAWAVFVGMAFGIMMPNLSTWLLTRIPATMRGRANGMFTMSVFSAQFMSAFVGPALIAQGDLRTVFWPMGILSISISLGLLAVAIIGPRNRA